MYRVFYRTWWRKSDTPPHKWKPHPGRKRTIGHALTLEQAQQMCKEYNDTSATYIEVQGLGLVRNRAAEFEQA